MDSIQIYLITAAIFLLGGAVKGTVGFGLPLVSITLLTPFYGLVDAIGLMVIPAVVTNFWQALAGGNFGVSWRRLWTLYVFGAVVTAISATMLLQIHSRWPMALLGAVIIVYSISGLAAWRYRPLVTREGGDKRYIQDYFRNDTLIDEFGVSISAEHTHVFACGNPAMIGIPKEDRKTGALHFETAGGLVEILVEKYGLSIHKPRSPGQVHYEKYW